MVDTAGIVQLFADEPQPLPVLGTIPAFISQVWNLVYLLRPAVTVGYVDVYTL